MGDAFSSSIGMPPIVPPMNGLLLAICLCCAPFALVRATSLCAPEETSLFTCSIGKKQISVCASKDLSPTSGHVQYRFGTDAQALELVYPAQKIHPATHFSVGFTWYAKGGLENLHFSQSGYSYTVYRESAAFDANGAGVRVKTPDGRSVRLACREDSPPSDLNVLAGLGLRTLPEESLVSIEGGETWPADSPNADLLWGVRTHDFALVTKALTDGANINFHGPNDAGILASLVDGRADAFRDNRVQEFDAETDRLLALLLSRGASPTISTPNGSTPIDSLANNAPYRTVRTLLDAGWPKDAQYRLYVGALLGDSVLIGEALDQGANPNDPVRKRSILLSAINRASALSDKNLATEQERALSALERLLMAGAQIDAGTPSSGGDIVRVCAYSAAKDGIRSLLELLVRYASPAARQNALSWAKATLPTQTTAAANIRWLIARLEP